MKVYIDWDERKVITEETFEKMVKESFDNWLSTNKIKFNYEFQEFAIRTLENQNISIYDLLTSTESEREKLLNNLKTEYFAEKETEIDEEFRCLWEEYEVL